MSDTLPYLSEESFLSCWNDVKVVLPEPLPEDAKGIPREFHVWFKIPKLSEVLRFEDSLQKYKSGFSFLAYASANIHWQKAQYQPKFLFSPVLVFYADSSEENDAGAESFGRKQETVPWLWQAGSNRVTLADGTVRQVIILETEGVWFFHGDSVFVAPLRVSPYNFFQAEIRSLEEYFRYTSPGFVRWFKSLDSDNRIPPQQRGYILWCMEFWRSKAVFWRRVGYGEAFLRKV